MSIRKEKFRDILKSEDPNKLVVYHASSLEDEIRFYINDTEYISARKEKNGTKTEVCIEEPFDFEIDEDKKIIEEYNSDNLTIFLNFFMGCPFLILQLVPPVVSVISIWMATTFIILTKNILLIIAELISLTDKRKSKHSAEHKIVNFMEKNRRLPKSLEELKKSSRFSYKCGTIMYVRGISKCIVKNILCTIATFGIFAYAVKYPSARGLNVIEQILALFGVMIINKIIVEATDMFDFTFKKMDVLFSYLLQCKNTTSWVIDDDLKLAYRAAWVWIQIAYPEFYHDECEHINYMF